MPNKSVILCCPSLSGVLSKLCIKDKDGGVSCGDLLSDTDGVLFRNCSERLRFTKRDVEKISKMPDVKL